MSNLSERLRTSREEIAILKAKMVAQSHDIFDSAIKEIFQLNDGQLEAIAWTQYTPYFNDGDVCEFTMGDIYFITDGIADAGIPESVYDFESDEYTQLETRVPDDWQRKRAAEGESWAIKACGKWDKIVDKTLPEACHELEIFMNKNGDIMEEIFGNHVRIIITVDKDGNIVQNVEEYEHD